MIKFIEENTYFFKATLIFDEDFILKYNSYNLIDYYFTRVREIMVEHNFKTAKIIDMNNNEEMYKIVKEVV